MPRRPGRLGGMLAAASFAGALLLTAPPCAVATPVNTSLPAITGALQPGQTLSATTGTWTDATSPIARYEYQWQHCVSSIEEEEGYDCTNIDYATASAYTLTSDLAGVQARAVVVATDGQGEVGIASSEVTDVIGYYGPRYTVGESVSGAGSLTGFEASPEATRRTADANLSCPGACGALYPYLPGTEVELVATPAPGAAFLGWGGACSGSAPTCSLTLGASVGVMATFSEQATTGPGSQGDEGGARPPSAGAPSRGAWEPSASSTAGRGLLAHLLAIHHKHHRIQAEVKCQQARSCQLSLAIFAGRSTSTAMIARRSFTIAARRSARISLALDGAGKRVLAKRHRLLVTTRLMLRGAGHPSLIEQGHFTLTG